MVYKRYIKRNGKTFGPYYYKSYRDETGKTRTKLVSVPKRNKFPIKLFYVLIIFSLFLTAGFVILNKNSDRTFDVRSFLIKDNPAKINLENSKIIGNIIKLIGFQVSQEDDSPRDDAAVPSGEPSPRDDSGEPSESEQGEETESLPDEDEQENAEEIIENAQENTEELPLEEEKEPVQNKISENISEISPEINQTKEIIEENTSKTRINNSKPQNNSILDNKLVTAQNNISNTTAEINIINETSQNISGINQTITENLTISELNQTIQGENFTINENIIQYEAKLGQPVKWKKTLKIDAGENKTLNNLEVTLPKTAGDVSVRKIFANESVEELEVNIKNEKIISETEPIITITGQSIKNNGKTSIFKKIFKFLRNFISLVGRVVDIGENEKEVLVNIQEELEDEDEIEIEYFTEAPYSEEIFFNDNHKKINVVGSEEIHYENVLAFSNLSKEVSSKNEINLYWIKNDSKELIDFNSFDLDENGEIDYIEWSVPSLSNQTYELILITKAQHLDSNKNFISDIYEEVKSLDGNWSEQINDSEYVRVTFEKNLTNQNDITIYPRTINGTPRIEVYENNKTELIAEFTNIIDNEYNKIYLTNLVGEQNTFDLKILNGNVEFDYIVDPFTGPSSGVWMDLSGNDTGNWVGTSGVQSVVVNTNNNLIYTGILSGKFGVYNHSNGVWMDLSRNDTGDWAGASSLTDVAVNTNDNLVYTIFESGKFGVYNHSNGVWMDLSANDTGNWVGTEAVNGVAVNTNDNLVYTTLDSGKFGVYNNSNGVWMDLSANDTGNWVDTDRVYSVAVNPNDNLVYTGLTSGKFGVYNHSNGIWMNLSGNDTGDWAGTDTVNGVSINTNNNLVYTGITAGKFGVYNHSNGVWMDLSGNDTGNWVGIHAVYGVAVNTNDNLVYTGFDAGKFGVYNNSNGVWMDLSGNDTGDWAGTDRVSDVAVNTNNNLIYTGILSGKFGVYRSDLFSGGGAGTLANPYEISDCIQLQNMSLNLNANYKLMNNIDCSDTINWNGGAGFRPVGENAIDSAGVFKGSLQGNDYNITNLYIKITGASLTSDCTGGGGNCTGMFGHTINATINKVHLWNVYVESNALVVGGLVGAFDDNGTISNSSVHGNVTSKGTLYAGGLAGWIWANKHLPKVYNSSFTGNLSARGTAGTGGLVGWSDGIINYSFADVKLNSTDSTGVGGLVGINAVDGSEGGIVDNSYSRGNVSVAGGSLATIIGGLVGQNSAKILHSYSAINVSGNNVVGGLVGNNVGNISNSYSCGGMINAGSDKIGGLVGTTQVASNISFSYSANILSLSEGVNIGGFDGKDEGVTNSQLNSSFYDYEIDGGNYNDVGNLGDVSGIYANTTAQMKKQGTYSVLGWDFTNIWQIAEDYSYPYFKWQTTPACGVPVPSAPPITGGSGSSPEIIELSQGFDVAPKKINITLNQSESKTECFTVTSTGTLSITTILSVSGEIIPFTSLTNSVLSIPVQNSKTACAIFSADKFDIPKKYTGQIQVVGKQKKYIDVFLEIREVKKITNQTIGVLPIGINQTIGVLPIGILGFLPSDPIRVLPLKIILPPIGILPVDYPRPIISKTFVKAVGFISLWILLLLLLVIYLAVRRFVKLQDQLEGYKSRDEKLAMIQMLKRNSLRKDSNFFEKIIDKGTIYLSEKALSEKTEVKIAEQKPVIESLQKTETKLISSSLPAYVKERYNRGAELYYKKDYENALKEFQKSVEIDNKFWQGYQGIGECYFAKGEIEKSKLAFEKSLSINPKNTELAEWMRKWGMKK